MVRVGASMGQWRLAHAGWPLRHRPSSRWRANLCSWLAWGDEAMVPEAWMPFFQTRTRWSWLSRTGTRLASKHPSSAMRSTASWKSMPQQACGMPWILPGTKTRSTTSWWRSGCGLRTFFDFGEEAGYGPTSYFVSAEGFFYVLCYRAADVAQRKFEGTPRWILQAGWNLS